MSADRSCDSCCVFPNFNINVDHLWNGEEFELGDTITNAVGATFRLLDYNIVFSDFLFVDNERVFAIADSFRISTSDGQKFILDDFVVIDNTTNNVTIGSINTVQNFDQIRFKIGLDQCVDDNELQVLEESSKSTALTSIQDDNGFRELSFILTDTLGVEYNPIMYDYSPRVEIVKAVNVSNLAGNILVLDVAIDYGIWLSEVDLSLESSDTANRLLERASSAISFTQ